MYDSAATLSLSTSSGEDRRAFSYSSTCFATCSRISLDNSLCGTGAVTVRSEGMNTNINPIVIKPARTLMMLSTPLLSSPPEDDIEPSAAAVYMLLFFLNSAGMEAISSMNVGANASRSKRFALPASFTATSLSSKESEFEALSSSTSALLAAARAASRIATAIIVSFLLSWSMSSCFVAITLFLLTFLPPRGFGPPFAAFTRTLRRVLARDDASDDVDANRLRRTDAGKRGDVVPATAAETTSGEARAVPNMSEARAG
mmetsp:Transcript_1053/g.3473  ORF Transcript_1053/g.3473 Transcript_1053/m.3473 type:complete len:259 (-) Transcript_1053:11-787(-)